LVIGLGLFAFTEPKAATSAFHSTKAVLLMVAVAAVWVAARTLTFAVVPRRLLRAVAFAVGALAILKVVVLPAYHDRTVVERLAADAARMTIETAELKGIDHRASGTVNVYRDANGMFVIGLEGIDIQPGPSYAVYVVPGSERRDRDGGTRLSKLRGNRGTQFYDGKAGIDLSDGAWTVLVWCETFDVPVAHATPA
jgi:hypothetical protein